MRNGECGMSGPAVSYSAFRTPHSPFVKPLFPHLLSEHPIVWPLAKELCYTKYSRHERAGLLSFRERARLLGGGRGLAARGHGGSLAGAAGGFRGAGLLDDLFQGPDVAGERL